MSRWQPNARERLENAALELYTERGFDQTTVNDIAQRAGLTERTFFRHFADKREVLFSGQEMLIDTVTDAVTSHPASATAFDAVAAGLAAFAPYLDARGDRARQRQRVIDANLSLQERELGKLATLADAMARALRGRGVAPEPAQMAAEAGLAVFKVAFARWAADRTARDYGTVLDDAIADFKALAGSPG
ncbi:TetR family transcriptional regulator [Mycobacterium sp. 236(2023)]|uniref:TetR family transcriptional regulator n=1 Tax=Mycobacterium sp. 236(2023) TaxID=3038163 RepID=UPI0024157AAC|nr:TetR family transcriptional regulator [Mycobacterium sp. 236(2023)]MDG4664538.1 TetR family transcriptional regulator [Mycobacterium sp. 236(2023)]